MLPTRKTLFPGNLLLIAIGCINLPIIAGGSLTGSLIPGVSDTECQKMEETFNRFDFDKNGEISRADMEDIATKFAVKENFQEVDKETAKKSFDYMFSFYTSLVGTTGDELTREMVDNCKNTHVSSDDRTQCKNRIGAVVDSLVKPMTVVHEDYLNSDEFSRVFESLGFTDVASAKAAFIVIDKDHDSEVKQQEFRDFATSYICTNDNKFIL